MPATIPDKTRNDLSFDALLEHLARRAHTELGAALCRRLGPHGGPEEVLARQAEISEARALTDSGEGLSFAGVRDVSLSLERARKGGLLAPAELCDIAATIRAGARLRRHLLQRAGRAPGLLGRAALLAELPEVAGPISDAFDDSGALRDQASPALKGLRQKAQALAAELSRRTEELLNQAHIAPYLQDRFVTLREERYVVPVRADARARVRGIVHGVSASGATVFVEPEEIIDLNNRLRLAQLEVADEERRILLELSGLVEGAAARIAQNLEILAVLDLIDAGARLSSDLRASPIGISEAEIDLRNARHPLLHLSGVKVVPSDVRLRRGGTLLISGPNAGGKTVALKLVGLCALMARAGLHCPVQEGSSLPIFDEVLTDIGDDQSIERNLSTFSAHVLNLCDFLRRAGPGALILLDEVAAGTDPDQGAALAQAILVALADRGATCVVTTHYDRLKGLAPQDPRFANASVGFDVERLQPTYRLHSGVPGASGALLVARRLGLPVEIAARAEALLGDRQAGLEVLLQRLAQERERLAQEREEAAARNRQAAEEVRAAEELSAQVRAELQRLRRGAHDEAVAALRRARFELEEARKRIRAEAGSKEALAAAERQIDQAAQAARAAAPEPALAGRPATAADLAIGTRVLVPRLSGTGTVMSDVMKDKVVVQVGALRISVDVAELRLPEGGAAPATRPAERAPLPAERPAPAARSISRSAAATLDLRGERVDAALARAEKFIDDALRDGQSEVFLLHGHGTGALRAAIRQHFGGFPGVARLYPASQADGGDGVTVIELQ